MNSRNLEQVRIFKRYLTQKAGRTRSRLMRAQIRRWVERLDAAHFDMRDEDERASEQITRLKVA